MRRVGLLGGAFNPPHAGHLELARLALAHLDLDELRFVPTARSPHKPEVGGPEAETRLRLVEGAAAALSDPRAKVCDLELHRGGASYTADTLSHLAAVEPGAVWILVLGADQLPGLPSWHRAEAIFALASVAVAGRPGWDGAAPAGLPLKETQSWSGSPGELVRLPSTGMPLSSSELRMQLRAEATEKKAMEKLPPQVLAAIRSENLYR